MLELKNKQVLKIKNATDFKSVEQIINDFILEMQKTGIENYRLKNIIKKLDIALMLTDSKELTENQSNNIKIAQKILVSKIIQGNRLDSLKSN